MPDNRRAPKLLAYVLAVPIIAFVYVATFGARVWAVLRPAAATLLGATVVGAIYAGEAWRRAPATPLRVAVTLGLAVVLVAPAVSPLPAAAAANPAEAVIAAARGYLGSDYRFGAEGPVKFDCSGLIYRVFKDVGELPRIGGMRLGATAYMRWFVARGHFSRSEADAAPGDLVVWDNGLHIGIYVGNGKTISALINPWGVTLHGVHAIPGKVTQFLLVNWGTNDGSGDNPGDPGPGPGTDPGPGDNPGPGDSGDSANPGSGTSDGNTGFNAPDNGANNPPPVVTPEPKPPVVEPPVVEPPAEPPAPVPNPGVARSTDQGGTLQVVRGQGVRPSGFNGLAIATVNLREQADINSRILGWVGSGGYVRIVGQAYSPQGYLYFQVQTPNGKTGFVYSRWVLNTPN